MKVPFHIAHGLRDIALAATAPHADLRRRLTSAVALTLAVTLLATAAIYLAERNHPQSDVRNLWDAFFFTSSQMTTLSASMANPVTLTGQVIVLIIDIYAITVVATLAGMFGAFFHHRSQERLRQSQDEAGH